MRPKKTASGDALLRAKIDALAEKIMANPNADGWVRLCEILKKAMPDKRIASSAGASEFLELMLAIASDALTTSTASQALKPLRSALTAEQLADNAPRHSGGKTMAKRAEDHEETITGAVLLILRNPSTSDWRDPKIARELMKRGFHKSSGKKPIELSEQTMTGRVKAIRDKYKEGELTS